MSLVDRKTVRENILQIPSSTLALYLWPSAVPAFLFCLPFKTLSRVSPSLPPLFFFSLLSSSLLSPLSSSFRSPCCFPPLWLWKPAVSNYGETKERTLMGFPAARPANQATRQAERQAGRQPQCFCGKQRLISSPVFLYWTKNTGRQCCWC